MHRCLNSLSALCRREADKWYHDPRTGEMLFLNHGERFMLMVSEISEAMEGARKNLMDDKLPHRTMVEVELADAIIRICDYAGDHNLDIGARTDRKARVQPQARRSHTRCTTSAQWKKFLMIHAYCDGACPYPIPGKPQLHS